MNETGFDIDHFLSESRRGDHAGIGNRDLPSCTIRRTQDQFFGVELDISAFLAIAKIIGFGDLIDAYLIGRAPTRRGGWKF
jgi:hypothetical protein